MGRYLSVIALWHFVILVSLTTPMHVYGYTHEIIVKHTRQLSHLTDTNATILIVKHIDLSGLELQIPKGCTLMFREGSISNGKIIAEDLKVSDWCFKNVDFHNPVTTINPILVPIVGAKDMMEAVLHNKSKDSIEPTIFLFAASKRYDWDGTLIIDRKNVTLTGGGTIEGHIHIGISANDFKDLHYDAYTTSSHANIIITGLRFSKYKLFEHSMDNELIEHCLAQATESDCNNISISITNASNVKITNCFFDNVPFPIVYLPNREFVNQNVRRLNIDNCDFERCKIAVYALSNTNNSLEYGDLMFTGNNVYPVCAGLILNNIDGFKCIGNTFSTCSRNQKGANIIAYRPGQVMIANNSFYGEYNQNAISLFDMGTGIIQGNLFSSQGVDVDPTTFESMACLQIQQTDKVLYTPSVEIVNNLFSNVNRLPILIDGDIRNFNLVGNSFDGPIYNASRRTLYYIHNKGPVVGNVQPNIRSANLLEDMSGTFILRMRIANERINGNTLHPDNKEFFNGFSLKTGENNDVNKIKSVIKSKYVAAITINDEPIGNRLSFMFNGLKFTLSIEEGATEMDLLHDIQEIINSRLSSDFETFLIEGVLWIAGRDSKLEPITPFYEMTSEAHTTIQCIFQNMGYKLVFENENVNPISYENKDKGLCISYFFDDKFIAYKYAVGRSSDDITNEIVQKIYKR